MPKKKDFRSYTFSEGRTGGGQLVEFTCRSEDVQRAKAILGMFRHIEEGSVTHRTNVSHGSYGRYSRYKIKQHKYAGGGHGGVCSYIEVLEIKDPPDGRCGIIIHLYNSRDGATFYECQTVKLACQIFEKHWGEYDPDLANLPGCLRQVRCGALTPWFYAIGDEELVGDYALPYGLENDPVYRLGRQFVVEENGIPTIKTCMGSRLAQRLPRTGYHDTHQVRLVYWDDGSTWEEGYPTPRPVEEQEMWITAAVQKFRELLGGKTTRFAIPFLDGTEFVGRINKPKRRTQCAAGDYYLKVTLVSGEVQEGWVNDFEPTVKAPDIIQYVTQRHPAELVRIEIVERKLKAGGKKWSGVFFKAPDRCD